MKITEHNATTGGTIDRDANPEEVAAFEVYLNDLKDQGNNRVAKAAAKAALLERLGITKEEASLLLG